MLCPYTQMTCTRGDHTSKLCSSWCSGPLINTFSRRSILAPLNDDACGVLRFLLLRGLPHLLFLCFEITTDVPVVFDVDFVDLLYLVDDVRSQYRS